MKNLAGNKDCDILIEQELARSRIEIVRGERRCGEVPASIIGKLGSFTFRRAWYYWIVEGNIPLSMARELYEDPVGKTDVRVSGHCMCPLPDEWVTWLDKDGKECISSKDRKELDELCKRSSLVSGSDLDKYRVSDSPTEDGFSAFITLYHIDTEIGLRLFADMIRKYNLV